MTALSRQPLLPLTKKQRGMIGEERARESYRAQLQARAVTELPETCNAASQMSYLISSAHTSANVTSGLWSAHAVEDVAEITRKVGNHVCRPDVCHKGRIGKKGFYRMFTGIGLVTWMPRRVRLLE